jgi:hypothetical protein
VAHLSDEQFEDAVREAGPGSPHLQECGECRRRLEELRAIRGRLQSAFASVTAPEALRERMRAAAGAGPEAVALPAPQPPRAGGALRSPLRRWAWPLAAAAAVLAAAIPLAIFLNQPSRAEAAQRELVQIHQQNLTDGHGFFSDDEPNKLAAYFREKLGFVPAMPKLNQGMAIRGCCVAHFRGKIAGSYVVDTPHGVVSVIVVTDPPASIGLARREGQAVWEGNLGMCNMAAVRVGDYTYTAVGEVSQPSLTQLLGLLVR